MAGTVLTTCASWCESDADGMGVSSFKCSPCANDLFKTKKAKYYSKNRIETYLHGPWLCQQVQRQRRVVGLVLAPEQHHDLQP